jgi:hypothetical protein
MFCAKKWREPGCRAGDCAVACWAIPCSADKCSAAGSVVVLGIAVTHP